MNAGRYLGFDTLWVLEAAMLLFSVSLEAAVETMEIVLHIIAACNFYFDADCSVESHLLGGERSLAKTSFCADKHFHSCDDSQLTDTMPLLAVHLNS